MNNFILELWDDEGIECTFYSVRWEDSIENETDKFFNKYDRLNDYKTSVLVHLPEGLKKYYVIKS